MTYLPFSARGPFKIAGKIDRYHWDKPSPRLLGVFWVVPFRYRKPVFALYSWWRKPPLSHYGPFKLSGRWIFPRLRFSRPFVIWLPMYGVVNHGVTRNSPIMEKACAVAWIYYSRNISTADTWR